MRCRLLIIKKKLSQQSVSREACKCAVFETASYNVENNILTIMPTD